MKYYITVVFIFAGTLLSQSMQTRDLYNQEPFMQNTQITRMGDCITIEAFRHIIASTITQCPCRKTSFNNINEIIEHIHNNHCSMHHLLQYLCPSCSYKTKDLDSLFLHFPLHTDEKIYKCADCGISFLDYRRVIEHLELHNDYQTEFTFLISRKSCKKNEQGSYQCPMCSCLVKHLLTFLKHIKNHLNMTFTQVLISPSQPLIFIDETEKKDSAIIEQPNDLIHAKQTTLLSSLLESFHQFGAQLNKQDYLLDNRSELIVIPHLISLENETSKDSNDVKHELLDYELSDNEAVEESDTVEKKRPWSWTMQGSIDKKQADCPKKKKTEN